MPGNMNGRELAENLWAERPDLKVIFTSGYSADIVGKDFKLESGLELSAETLSSADARADGAPLPRRQTSLNRLGRSLQLVYSNFSLPASIRLNFNA